MKALLLILVATLAPAANANQSEINAMTMCRAAQSTGYLMGNCRVRRASQTIDMPIYTSVTEATKMCNQMSFYAGKLGLRFDNGWFIRIIKPIDLSVMVECGL